MMSSNDNGANIIEGPPLERSINFSLGDLFLMVLKTHGDKILQVDATTGETLSATQLLNRSIYLAKWLISNNIGPGDVISISSENCLEFCSVPIAAFLTGTTLAPLNHEYTKGEIKHGLNLSLPKIVFCSPKTYQQYLSDKGNYPFLKKIVLFGSHNPGHSDIVMYQDIVKNAPSNIIDEEFEATSIDPEETTAVILCSSGTTGLPKGVMTTHSNITCLVEVIRQAWSEVIDDDIQRVTTGLAPFFHGFGFMLMLLMCLAGNKLVVYSRFDPKQFLESIPKFKISILAVPPPILSFMIKYPLVQNYDMSSIEEVRSGAAPISGELEVAVTQRLNAKETRQNYGLTESTLSVLVPLEIIKKGSVGSVVPGMKCKVIDEKGRALGPNKNGELCFKGPLIMKGYIGDPKATAETIDSDGWLHTGDVGYYDDDRCFYIVDRLKELIKYKGFQVAPAELEGILLTHPEVIDTAVVGLKNDIAGELPLAFVVKKPGSKITAEELENFVEKQVSQSKRLRGGVMFIDNIPKNPSGKKLRRLLRDKANKFNSKI